MRCSLVLVLATVASVASVGCSGGQKTGDNKGGGSGAAGGSEAAPRADGPITRDDCLRMIDHVLGLAVERRKQKKPEQPFTQEDVDAARKKMIDEQMDACLAFDRPTWQCVMAATTPEATGACAEGSPPPK